MSHNYLYFWLLYRFGLINYRTYHILRYTKHLRKNNETILVRPSTSSDIDAMVLLSRAKRKLYEKAQPQFWKYAGDIAELSQAKWFEELLGSNDHIMLTATSHQKIVGFIIGKLMPAPEVYKPGGLTLMIDDFCVADESQWHSIGFFLVQEIKAIAKLRGAAQVLVVCGAHDESKRRFLMNQNLSIASEWFVGGIV
jgi:ribosomal protein S18 acetylase RimI-like enzyme